MGLVYTNSNVIDIVAMSLAAKYSGPKGASSKMALACAEHGLLFHPSKLSPTDRARRFAMLLGVI